MRSLLIQLAVVGALALPSTYLHAQDKANPAADDTKNNKQNRSQDEPTADQAKNNAADRATMQKIRKSLMDDKSLSSSAHNVKVIAQNGKVTLRGPVRSEEEKRIVEQKAAEVAGSGNVVNEISIVPAK